MQAPGGESAGGFFFVLLVERTPPAAEVLEGYDIRATVTAIPASNIIKQESGREGGPMRGRAVSVSVISVVLALFLAGAGWGEPLQKKSISLEDARKAAAAAATEAKKNKWTMAIAVVDDGGLLVYFERIDETQFGSIDIAIGKARTAASLKRPTKALEDALNKGQYAILAFPNILPREGGLPIFADGKVVGAIGVSGGTSTEDAQVANAGVDALKK